MRYMRLPFIYPYRSVNIKYANLNDALTEAFITPMPRLGNVDPKLLKLLAPQSITTYNLPSLSPSVEQPANTSVNPPVQNPNPEAAKPAPANTQSSTGGAAGSDKPIIRKGRPGTGNKPLTRREAERLMRKFQGSRALGFGRAAGPGMGFGGALMWTALGGLGGVLLDRLLSSGRKKHEPSYYAPYIPGYRLY